METEKTKTFFPLLTTKAEREQWLREYPEIECTLVSGKQIYWKGGDKSFFHNGVPHVLIHILKRCFFEQLKRIRKQDLSDYPALRFFNGEEPALRWGKGYTLRIAGETDDLIELYNKIGFTVNLYPMGQDKTIIIFDPSQPK